MTLPDRLARLLLLHAALLPFSIVLGQPLAYLGAVGFLVVLAMGKVERLPLRTFGWWIALFMACAVVASAQGWDPARSFRKMDRLLLLAILPALAVLFRPGSVTASPSIGLFANAFVLGTSLLAAKDFIRIPMELNLGVDLFHTGNMRDPQFYMVSLALIIGAIAVGRWSLRHPVTATALIFNALGLLLHFKRGAWISFAVAALVMAVLLRQRKVALAVLVAVAAVVTLGPVRERWSMIQEEFTEDLGGRYLLWTEVAPRLLAEHPLGVGWKAVSHERLLEVSEQVQSGLNHLHNNILQIALETGWLGAVAWTGWMVHVLILGLATYRRLPETRREERAVLVGALGGFIALMVNGMVEFNFGDSEIFMTLNLLMGIILCISRGLGKELGASPFPVDPAHRVA
ncbi:MAG TPA: O-antigen ligase family protein [Kiritimatiellia bacterium]|nr:O-antigen ligase family protein [Kiritimatiellia bacterium]